MPTVKHPTIEINGVRIFYGNSDFPDPKQFRYSFALRQLHAGRQTAVR
ncbi:MAG: hypothetical protein L0212_01475 [Acidobacteria bacterium]|nr:hypothetical protein [Acidobacteriota bacterium]